MWESCIRLDAARHLKKELCLRAYFEINSTTYWLIEVTPEEMDALLARKNPRIYPFCFDRRKRIYPKPPRDLQVEFIEVE